MATFLEGINAEVVGKSQLARICLSPAQANASPGPGPLPLTKTVTPGSYEPLPVPLFTVRVYAPGLLSTPIYGLIQPDWLASGPLKPVKVFPSTPLSQVVFGSLCHEPDVPKNGPMSLTPLRYHS